MSGLADQLVVLRERCAYLSERISAKQRDGWDTRWDERERDALLWVLAELEAPA